jgi:hypothetical protein
VQQVSWPPPAASFVSVWLLVVWWAWLYCFLVVVASGANFCACVVGIVVEVFLFCRWCFPPWCNFSTTPE